MAATIGQGFSTKLLLEIIIGYLQSGKPIANIAFTTYGSTAQLKLAHYMKIPPKVMFLIHISDGLLACVVSLCILYLLKNICYLELLTKENLWTCRCQQR
ncbi:unnamed protein product [Musa hybrid cultivar]